MNFACRNDLTVLSLFLLSCIGWGSNVLVGEGFPVQPDCSASFLPHQSFLKGSLSHLVLLPRTD